MSWNGVWTSSYIKSPLLRTKCAKFAFSLGKLFYQKITFWGNNPNTCPLVRTKSPLSGTRYRTRSGIGLTKGCFYVNIVYIFILTQVFEWISARWQPLTNRHYMHFPSWLGFIFLPGVGKIKGNISWCLSFTFLITTLNTQLWLFNSVGDSFRLTVYMIVFIYKWWPDLASPVGTTLWNNNTEMQRAVAYVDHRTVG